MSVEYVKFALKNCHFGPTTELKQVWVHSYTSSFLFSNGFFGSNALFIMLVQDWARSFWMTWIMKGVCVQLLSSN